MKIQGNDSGAIPYKSNCNQTDNVTPGPTGGASYTEDTANTEIANGGTMELPQQDVEGYTLAPDGTYGKVQMEAHDHHVGDHLHTTQGSTTGDAATNTETWGAGENYTDVPLSNFNSGFESTSPTTTGATGSENTQFDNRPPYKELIFIMKT